LPGAKSDGFIWAVSLLARSADRRMLYDNLCEQWDSLKSITGKYFLFVVAGCENADGTLENDNICFLNDGKNSERIDRVINNRLKDPESFTKQVEHTQTGAVNALSEYFGIDRLNTPCLVFTNLRREKKHIVVNIEKGANDLYGYFCGLFEKIDPILKNLDERENTLSQNQYNAMEIPEPDAEHERYLSEIETIIKNSAMCEIINNVKNAANAAGLPQADIELINQKLDIIVRELQKKKPEKGALEKNLSSLKVIKVGAEVSVPVVNLINFVISML
jgi:hypothetical protein